MDYRHLIQLGFYVPFQRPLKSIGRPSAQFNLSHCYGIKRVMCYVILNTIKLYYTTTEVFGFYGLLQQFSISCLLTESLVILPFLKEGFLPIKILPFLKIIE